ncbi:MAG: TonB-dependent receptor domain-containing protein, partial [Inhella sp.]
IFDKYAGPLQASANHQRLIPDSITGDYRASEDVQAAYLRLDGRWNTIGVITGLRYERTKAEGSANQFNTTTGAITARQASRSYGDWLPSVHLRQAFGEDRILRASYSTGLNRPDFIHTAPYRTLGDQDSAPVTEGNPLVKAAYAHNLDLSVEQYLRPLGLVSVALFHKRINDPLFVARRNEAVAGGLSRQVTRPENGRNGRVHGFELAWQQTLDMLPAPFNGFGVYANYTFAKSSAELPFGLGKTELPGTSRHNVNVAISYEAHGLTARLAYNHRSRFIQAFDISDPALNVYWDARSSVDLSASYSLTKQWKVFAEANNLTDSRQARFQGSRNRVLELEGFGRSWLAGLKFEY